MKDSVKAVVFDFGGVMTRSTAPDRVRPVAEELGIAWELLNEGYRRYRLMMDGGFIDMATMYSLILADAAIEIPAAALARIVAADEASFVARNERTLAWMKALKAQGYRIGILTNMPPAFAVIFRREFAEFIAQADALVISGEERMYKPQRRIYDLLRSRLGLPAESLLFVDDLEPNCQAARAAGWQALRFESNDQVEAAFAAL